jgi:hypothetical protein
MIPALVMTAKLIPCQLLDLKGGNNIIKDSDTVSLLISPDVPRRERGKGAADYAAVKRTSY